MQFKLVLSLNLLLLLLLAACAPAPTTPPITLPPPPPQVAVTSVTPTLTAAVAATPAATATPTEKPATPPPTATRTPTLAQEPTKAPPLECQTCTTLDNLVQTAPVLDNIIKTNPLVAKFTHEGLAKNPSRQADALATQPFPNDTFAIIRTRIQHIEENEGGLKTIRATAASSQLVNYPGGEPVIIPISGVHIVKSRGFDNKTVDASLVDFDPSQITGIDVIFSRTTGKIVAMVWLFKLN